jgi:hypothetical protein
MIPNNFIYIHIWTYFFFSWNAWWYLALECTDFTHLFYLDAITTAIWHVSSGLIILSVLCLTMAYASSDHNNLDSLAEIVIFCLIVS